MTRPTFSVVVPCYRAAPTIRTTLASVLAQTDQDFEVLLVEDGCPAGGAQCGDRSRPR